MTRADGGTAGEDVYVGLDLGTSGLKGVAVGAGSGLVLGRAGAAYPTRSPQPGAFEQDPADWIAAAVAVAGQLRAAVPARRWRGIGLSAMLPTLVAAPAGPAITWQDARAEPEGERLRSLYGGSRLYQRTGQWLDGRYLLPMFARLAVAAPGRAAATARLLSAKDYLYCWLTGAAATDPSTAAGFGCYDLRSGRWDEECLAAAAEVAGRPLPALPEVEPSTAHRPLTEAAAGALRCGRVPVCVGAADSVLGALGLGVRAPGQVAYVAGTSTVILGVSGSLVFDDAHRFLVTPLAEPGAWGLEMDLLATGSAVRWLTGLLGWQDEAELLRQAAGTDPLTAPVVLPYLSPGEQGALWDPVLHGAVTGLTLAHQRRHLARGLVNGLVLESRRCLAVLGEVSGAGGEVAVAGGSAADAGFRADLADASGRPVRVPADHDTDHSARGAALLAARSIGGGWPPGHGGPAAGPVLLPDPDRGAAWDRLWTRHEQARAAVAGLADGLSGGLAGGAAISSADLTGG